MSLYLPPVGPNPAWQPLQPTPWVAAGAGTSASILLSTSSYPGKTVYLDGIQLVNPAYDNGNNANVFLVAPGYPGGQVTFFQGFVYTSSQALFEWSGHFPMTIASTQLEWDPVIGTWNIICWGTLYPNLGS